MEIGLGFDDNQQAKEIDIFLFCLGNIYIYSASESPAVKAAT